jgi:hypothetical protein
MAGPGSTPRFLFHQKGMCHMVRLIEKLGDRALARVVPKATAEAAPPPGCWCDQCTGAWSFRCCWVSATTYVCTTQCVSC